MKRLDSARSPLLCTMLLLSGVAFSQAVPWFDEPLVQKDQTPLALSGEAGALPIATMAPQPSTVTIPAGTRVLMVLKSPLHTTSGTAGSGIYLETLYPVVQGNRVVIPARTQVQGVVEANQRPGHVKRASEFRFRFTTLIFANNYVAPIEGALQSIPGAKNIRTHDRNGTLKPVDQAEKVITPAAVSAVGGAIIGAHRGFGIGLLPGAGLGAVLGVGSVLLKRGDEISLTRGTNVEMILQAPLTLEEAQVPKNARYIAPRAVSFEPVNDSLAVSPEDSGKKRRREHRTADLSEFLFFPD